VILGFWKVLGVVAPRFPILKEWAYAGMFFTMTGAAVSHVVVGDPAVMLVAPIIFTGFVIVSWALRSVAHRDTLADSAFSSRSRTVAYWVATELLALECGVGGVLGALRLHHSPGLWRISVTRPI
jgi:DoxX-like protein